MTLIKNQHCHILGNLSFLKSEINELSVKLYLIARHCKSAPVVDVVSCLFENKYFRSAVFVRTVMFESIIFFLAIFYIVTLTRNARVFENVALRGHSYPDLTLFDAEKCERTTAVGKQNF